MPIVINEVVFKATLTSQSQRGADPGGASRQPALDKKALIEACVEEVLKILEKEKER
jgi:hypothetical protein